MCGIAAIINCSDAEFRLAIMLKQLKHRGDYSNPEVIVDSKVALGMRRLRIVDEENAIQPMWSFDKQWIIIYNGEIYNYKELRIDLIKKGAIFQSNSDTEVLINGITVYGKEFLALINGMFAFVAYNLNTKEFIAGRDPIGIKPLYYEYYEDGICFASEINPLLNATEKGDILALAPGTVLTNQGLESYPVAVNKFISKDLNTNARYLYKTLEDAVKIRLPENLDAAIKFGGGIDSTLILHYAQKFRPDIKAYFIGVEGGKDMPYAFEYAEKCKTNLQVIDFDEEKVFSYLERIVNTVETFEPNMVRNAAFSFLLSERIHQDGIRVALCGEGADELFWGYPEMRMSENIPQTSANFLNDLHRTQLQRVDRCSMHFQLETRVPFFDPRIIDFANKIPPHQKIGYYENSLYEKIILRELYNCNRALPQSIKLRKKIVFADGAGMGNNNKTSGPFYEYANQKLSTKDFENYKKKYTNLKLETKEEALYLQILEKKVDISRVESIYKRPAVNRVKTL